MHTLDLGLQNSYKYHINYIYSSINNNYFSDYLNAINHFNFKLSIFVAILQVLKSEFQKIRILEILNFHPCIMPK